MPNLRSLQLSSTLMGGRLPEYVSAPQLTFLDISGNSFSGTVPCCLRRVSTSGLYLFVDGNNLIHSVPTFGPCGFDGLSISKTNITSLPSNFSAIFPYLTYLAISGLPLTELPPIADVSNIIIDASDNVFELPSLDQSFSNPQSLDFAPRYPQDAVNFSKMCRGNCTVAGAYVAQQPTCMTSVPPFLCSSQYQNLQVDYSTSEFAEGSFLSPVRFGMRDLNGRFPSGFIDLTCPSIANAILVPTLRQLSPAELPSYATEVSTPLWNSIPLVTYSFIPVHRDADSSAAPRRTVPT
jgi:hypothetical protein